MKNGRNKSPALNREAFVELLAACRSLKFEPHDIASRLDARGHFELSLDKESAFNELLFHFGSKPCTPIWDWHKQLDLAPQDGPVRMRMGDLRVGLTAGDAPVADNFKLHNVEDLPRVTSIT